MSVSKYGEPKAPTLKKILNAGAAVPGEVTWEGCLITTNGIDLDVVIEKQCDKFKIPDDLRVFVSRECWHVAQGYIKAHMPPKPRERVIEVIKTQAADTGERKAIDLCQKLFEAIQLKVDNDAITYSFWATLSSVVIGFFGTMIGISVFGMFYLYLFAQAGVFIIYEKFIKWHGMPGISTKRTIITSLIGLVAFAIACTLAVSIMSY